MGTKVWDSSIGNWIDRVKVFLTCNVGDNLPLFELFTFVYLYVWEPQRFDKVGRAHETPILWTNKNFILKLLLFGLKFNYGTYTKSPATGEKLKIFNNLEFRAEKAQAK